jgi:hypothetical protein
MRIHVLAALMALGFFGLAGSSPAVAQTDDMSVKVPFPFVVGRTELPAGTYRMLVDFDQPDLVLIVGEDGRERAMVFTDWSDSPDLSNQASFEFAKTGGRYVLTAIRVPGESVREVVLPESQGAAPR